MTTQDKDDKPEPKIAEEAIGYASPTRGKQQVDTKTAMDRWVESWQATGNRLGGTLAREAFRKAARRFRDAVAETGAKIHLRENKGGRPRSDAEAVDLARAYKRRVEAHKQAGTSFLPTELKVQIGKAVLDLGRTQSVDLIDRGLRILESGGE
jgi:hypothetical protein